MRHLINNSLHLFGSAFLVWVFYSIHPMIAAVLFTAFIGMAKEYWDYHNPPHCCDGNDLLMDLSGILISILAWLIL